MTISEIAENNTDNMSVVININDKVPTEEHAVRVCVCRVPKSLSCGKPEAFVPHFLGLGPYHHNRFDLTMTDELKLAAAMRIRKHAFEIRVSDVQPFYHQDAFNSFYYKDEKLLHDITVDGLFLLALLERSVDAQPQQDRYFLTGKHGMPLVNAFGVELTMDAIIRDVFKLENQIPTHVLEQINQVSCQDQVHSQDFGAKMLSFCQNHCPLVNSEKLSEKAEKHDHLLDLMYNLVAPKPPQPKTEKTEKTKSIAKPNGKDKVESPEKEKTVKPESSAKSKDNIDNAENPDKEKIAKPESSVISEGNTDNAESPDKEKSAKLESSGMPDGNTDNKAAESQVESDNGTQNRCCSICFNIIVFIGVVCLLLWYLVYFISLPIFWVLRFLYGILKMVSSFFVKLSTSCLSMVDSPIDVLPQSQKDKLSPFLEKVKQTNDILKEFSGKKDAGPAVTIPSVTELNDAGIHFEPAKGGIEDLKFSAVTCKFSLPVIKLDGNSEVIMRNLMAYESLTRPTYLIFSRYVEIMRAIIDTPEDVHLLVENKIIIDTELSNKVVADLFNGMSTSIRPTNTPELEIEIKKVNAKFESSQWLQKMVEKYVYSSWKILTAIAALSFLVLTAVQTYCSIYACSSRSASYLGNLPPDSGHGFISSM